MGIGDDKEEAENLEEAIWGEAWTHLSLAAERDGGAGFTVARRRRGWVCIYNAIMGLGVTETEVGFKRERCDDGAGFAFARRRWGWVLQRWRLGLREMGHEGGGRWQMQGGGMCWRRPHQPLNT